MAVTEQPRYPSWHHPVAAENMVATSQPLAAQAGLDMLRRGGNAADAAIAAAITLTIVEPTSNGIGSDAFALIHDGQQLHGLNASGRSPAAWTLEYFAGHKHMPQFGWDAVTVPGAVQSWIDVSRRFGRLAYSELFEPAIHYARDGFAVGPRTAWHWQHDPPRYYSDFADFAEHFLPAPAAGERVMRPDAATTLEMIKVSEGESFYRGELAQRMAAAARDGGGALSEDDLANHQNDWVTPVTQPYRDAELHEIPPNGQGLAALIALGILNYFDAPPLDSSEGFHLHIEAMKIGLAAAADHIADPASMHYTTADLLAATSLARAAASIGSEASALPPHALPSSPDTVYLSAADSDGMMVSFIQSNYYGFGSGIVVPGTGIALQNRGFGFSLDPNHANCVAPRKRPFHTIIPAFATRNGQPWCSFGVMGGPIQAQGHVQMMVRLVDYAQDPQTASDAPRWQILDDYSVLLEPSFPSEAARALSDKGHAVRYADDHHAFGGAQLIMRTPGGYCGGSDHRKEGQVCGF